MAPRNQRSDADAIAIPASASSVSNDFNGTYVRPRPGSAITSGQFASKVLRYREVISVRGVAPFGGIIVARLRPPFPPIGDPLICALRHKRIHRYKGTRQWPAASVALFHHGRPKMRLTCDQTCSLAYRHVLRIKE